MTDLHNWISFDLYKPYHVKLYSGREHHSTTHRPRNHERERGRPKENPSNVSKADAKSKWKYVADASSRGYTEIDHFALYLRQVVEANRDDYRWLFYRKNITQGQMEAKGWQVSVLCHSLMHSAKFE